MSLNDEQKDFLPLLKVGEAIVYSGGWHAPVWVKVRQSQNTTGQSIDEDLIRQRGKAQLWHQRKVLLPKLTNNDFLNDTQLSEFLRDGLSLINRVLKLLNIRTDAHKTVETARIISAIQNKMQHWLSQLANDEQQLTKLLSELFIDVAQLEDTEMMHQSLRALFVAVLNGQEALNALLTEAVHRSIKNHLDSLKQIDSI